MILPILLGICLLMFCILVLKLPAFLSLLVASIVTGLGCGLDSQAMIETISEGMGSTLGFVATVVGLGTIFGGILEKTNGAKAIAQTLLRKLGEKRAPTALMLTGFLVAIPVFFDVGFIILFPLILALHQKTKVSIIHYAVPLLAGLAVTHACIPPTPGPIAVVEILGADMAWVIGLGVLIGIPMAYIGGIVYGKYLGDRLDIQMMTTEVPHENHTDTFPAFGLVMSILVLPIFLIVIGTLTKNGVFGFSNGWLNEILVLIGHPFTALLIANIAAWYFCGIGRGWTAKALAEISAKSLQPAGIIILVTGAGGVYKQTLIDTGAGTMLAEQMQAAGFSIIVFAWLASLVIRVLQGSATVAMITGAGLVAPLLTNYTLTPVQTASLVIAISSGATMVSHLNDSGFWLVKEYLQLSETQGMRTWTIASTIIGLVGFVGALIVFYVGA